MRAEVTIVERSLRRIRELAAEFDQTATVLVSDEQTLEACILDADLVIGAVLVKGAVAPKLVTREMLSAMRPRSVMVDVAIDQGGCFETSRPTTHTSPTYEVEGVTHYCVANMPGAVPVTSTRALTNATFPYVAAIADHGLWGAIEQIPGLAGGVNVVAGHVTHAGVAAGVGVPYTPLAEVAMTPSAPPKTNAGGSPHGGG